MKTDRTWASATFAAVLTMVSFLEARGETPSPFPAPTSQTTIPKQMLSRTQVTAQTMANLPAGKPLLVDVTRTGAIYELAGGIDISRVRIRTLTGEEALVDLMKQAGLVRASSGGKLVLGGGRVGDFYSLMPTTSLARATNQFDCTATGACRCKGIEDCRKMQEKHPNCKVVIVDQETGYTYCIEPR